jgi:ribosomal protein S18 acetylase RimI-like enzyme
MTEFYKLRRTKITDGMALLGFLIGFFIPAYSAGKRMAEGFDLGLVTEGLTQFVLSILMSAVTGGVIGLVVGLVAGRVWEAIHKARRKTAAAARLSEADGVSRPRPEFAATAPRPANTGLAGISFDDSGYTAEEYMALMRHVDSTQLDVLRTDSALQRTLNIGAWHGERLVGAVRLLTDGYLYATVTDLVVHPDYRLRGIGRELMTRALNHAGTGVVLLGSPPSASGFFEKLGCIRAPSGYVLRKPTAVAAR